MTDRIPYPRGVRSHRDLDRFLGTLHMGDKQDFLEPRGRHNVTFVHLAAYSGNLRILERADALGVDLNTVDGFGRSALHHAAFKGQVDVLKWLFNRPDSEKLLELKNSNGDTALYEAIEGLHHDPSRISRKFNLRNVAALQLLVDKGADVNASNTFGFPPLFVAGYILVRNGGPDAAMWYEKVVDILVSAGASVNLRPGCWVPGYKALDCAVVLESVEATRQLVNHGAYIVKRGRVESPSVMTALHLAAASRCPEILQILAGRVHSSAIDVQNIHGMTPLHCAVQTGHARNFRTLINHGANLLATNFEGKTVLQVLFGNRERPVAYLTDCLNLQVDLANDEIVDLDFKVLLPPGRRQMEVISVLIGTVPNMNEMTILQHPLLDAFLRLKWSKFRYFFFGLCTLHACFLIVLFWYAVVLIKTKNNLASPPWPLLPCAIIQLAHNALLFFIMPSHYVRQFEQWLSVVCVTSSIGIAVAGELISDSMNGTPLEDRSTWLLNTVSIVILLVGIQLMLIIGRFPTSGFYTLMFFTVLKNVAKLFLVFACLILSFAFSFLIILHGENQFRNPWVMIVKTVVMMTGEYDYGDFLAATSKEQSMGSSTTAVVGGIIFLLFVMFASIVLMNLITALAVTDVQGLVKKGELLGLMKQVEFMTQFEQVTAHWIFSSNWMPECLKKMIKREIRNNLWLKRAWFRSHYKQFVYRPRCIPEKLMKTLFTLGEKNRDSEKKSQLQLLREEPVGELTETVLDLQKQIRELEKENRFYRRRVELSGDEPDSESSEAPRQVIESEPIDPSSIALVRGEE